MSQDFQLAFPCPHIAMCEPVQLQDDRVTLGIAISATSVSDVRLNGVSVPPTGLLTSATLVSARRAPFRVYPDATDFRIEVTGGLSYDFVLPPGLLSMSQVVEILNAAKSNAYEVSQGDNGTLHLKDLTAKGPGSRIRVRGGAASALGFERQVGASGREVCPPWSLANDGTRSRPYFHYPPKINKSARWEVTYMMDPDACRRCMSSRVENDLRFRADGGPGLISDENLLYQMVMKNLLTELGSNPYHSWYGTPINSIVGQKGNSAVVGQVRDIISRQIAALRGIQAEQGQYQKVTLAERIESLDRLDVRPHELDPTTLLVELVVRNASRRRVGITIVFTTPGTVGTLLRNGKVVNRLGGTGGGTAVR